MDHSFVVHKCILLLKQEMHPLLHSTLCPFSVKMIRLCITQWPTSWGALCIANRCSTSDTLTRVWRPRFTQAHLGFVVGVQLRLPFLVFGLQCKRHTQLWFDLLHPPRLSIALPIDSILSTAVLCCLQFWAVLHPLSFPPRHHQSNESIVCLRPRV